MQYENPRCDSPSCWFKRGERSDWSKVHTTSVECRVSASAHILRKYGISKPPPTTIFLCEYCVFDAPAVVNKCHLCQVPMMDHWIGPLDGMRGCAHCIPPERISERAALGADYDVLVKRTGSTFFLVDLYNQVPVYSAQSSLSRPWSMIHRSIADARVSLLMEECNWNVFTASDPVSGLLSEFISERMAARKAERKLCTDKADENVQVDMIVSEIISEYISAHVGTKEEEPRTDEVDEFVSGMISRLISEYTAVRGSAGELSTDQVATLVSALIAGYMATWAEEELRRDQVDELPSRSSPDGQEDDMEPRAACLYL